MHDSAELIWRLAKEGKTQPQIADILGWKISKVSNYALLQNISEEAWKVISTTTEKAVGVDGEEGVGAISTGVETFTENLLRSILPLTKEQQLELAVQWCPSFPAAPCGWPAIPRRRLPRRRGFHSRQLPTG